LDKSARCGTCGGVWTESWVINSIAEGKELGILDEGLGKEIKPAGVQKCPADGNRLAREEGDDFPAEVELWRCHKCNRWWLPGGNIFRLKQAYEVKAEYRRLWSKSRRLTGLALPVVLTAVLILGLGVMVMAVGQSQQMETLASSPVIGRVTVMYLGENRVQMRFRAAREIETALYKRDADEQWSEALVLPEGDWKVILISGINPGERIWLAIEGSVWKLMVGQRQ
jgi:hypothetical protein